MFDWGIDRRHRAWVKRLLDESLAEVNTRLSTLEHEMQRYVRRLDTVLNGLNGVNQRLVKEKTDPAVAVKELRRSQPYRALKNRLEQLENDVRMHFMNAAQRDSRQNDLESEVERHTVALEHQRQYTQKLEEKLASLGKDTARLMRECDGGSK